jgi:prepilin-type processing-associated H-X9-DG protein
LPFHGGKGKMWHCTSATMSSSDYSALSGGGVNGFFSYAFNIDLKKDGNGANLQYPRMPKMSTLPKTSATVLIFDCVFNPVTEIVNGAPQYNSVNPANRFRSIASRHSNGAVMSFCDGHALYYKDFAITNNPAGASEPQNAEIIWDWTAR